MAKFSDKVAPSGVMTPGGAVSELTNDAGYTSYSAPATGQTGYFALPSGTTAQRPGLPAVGYARYNTSEDSLEYYTSQGWVIDNQRPTITGVSGTIFTGFTSTLTLSVSGTRGVMYVSFYAGSTKLATTLGNLESASTCTVSVPSAVYEQSVGTSITIKVANDNGVESTTSQSVTIANLPSGGSVLTVGTYRVHRFFSSGTFYANGYSGPVEYLVVAGGGGAGIRVSRYGGAGGAGGLRSSISGVNSGGGASAESALSVTSGSSYTVTVGAGGAIGAPSSGTGYPGGASVFASITSVGGGGGGSYGGGSGGSGGGGAAAGVNVGGAGTAGQGYSGGTSGSGGAAAGGGGGAAGAGGQSLAGSGLTFTDKVLTGSVTYATGGVPNTGAAAATANTGNGGPSNYSYTGYAGGSGVVIVRYQL